MLPILLLGPALAAGPLVLPAEDPLRLVLKHPLAEGPLPAMATALAAPQEGWDVEHYTIRVEIDPGEEWVEVDQEIVVSARADDPGPLILHGKSPSILLFEVEGEEADWERSSSDGRITVQMPESIDEGEAVALRVVHRPRGVGTSAWYGLHWGDPTWTMHQPDGAREWLVVYDQPGDKATLRWEVTAPSDLEVVTNGEVESITDNGDGTRTTVRDFPFQIPPYLFVMNVGSFEEILHDGPVPVSTFATRRHAEQAGEDLANTGEMIEYLSALWGDYPWTHYNNVVVPFGGGMEHITATSFGQDLIGSDWAEWVNVHELGHHWWGDLVTCETWEDIWLNEGFASYTEVLWAEAQGGEDWRRAYMYDQRETYFAWQSSEGISPLHDPNYLFGGTVYQKGSLVLHMLRRVMGDDTFFAGLTAYGETFAEDNASSADLQAVMEDAHGESLDWFFEQWVYRAGDPSYIFGATVTERDGGRVQLDLHVAQDGSQTWRMPILVRIEHLDGSTEDVIAWANGAQATTSFCLDATPVDLGFDPDEDQLYVEAERNDRRFSAAPDVCSSEVDTGGPDGSDTGEDGSDPPGAEEEPGIRSIRDGGCSCSSGGPGALGLWGLLVGLVPLLRRRR